MLELFYTKEGERDVLRKENFDKNKFISYAEAEGFEIHDLTDTHKSTDEFENVTEAIKKYDWNIYFYTLKSVEIVDSFFDRKIDEFSQRCHRKPTTLAAGRNVTKVLIIK